MTEQHTDSSRSFVLISRRVEFVQRSNGERKHGRQHAVHVPLTQFLKDQPAAVLRTNYHRRKPTTAKTRHILPFRCKRTFF